MRTLLIILIFAGCASSSGVIVRPVPVPVDSAIVVDEAEATDYINVKAFGATGDQVHDDTDAFEKCFAYIKSLNKSLVFYIPIGNYRITRELVFDCPKESSPRFLGSNKGRGNGGSTLVWYGPAGGTMIRFIHMIYSSIEYIDFAGDNGTGYPTPPKHLIHFDYNSPGNYSTTNKIINCSFSSVSGDSSACVNVNVGGPFSNNMVDEVTFDHCIFSGYGFTSSFDSWYGILLGQANTKNFFLRGNNITGFTHAAVKAGYCGPLHSQDNLISVCTMAFDLINGTTFLSNTDYSESIGMFLQGGAGTAAGSYTIIGYEFHSDNYGGYNPDYPVTKEYIIQGRGQLTIIGCTFNTGTYKAKINWDMESNASTVTVMGSNFAEIKEGFTPFYSNTVPVYPGDSKYHLVSINNSGTKDYSINYRIPNRMQ